MVSWISKRVGFIALRDNIKFLIIFYDDDITNDDITFLWAKIRLVRTF